MDTKRRNKEDIMKLGDDVDNPQTIKDNSKNLFVLFLQNIHFCMIYVNHNNIKEDIEIFAFDFNFNLLKHYTIIIQMNV